MDTEDPFLDSDGVRLAIVAGADPSDPAGFFQALIDIVDNPEYAELMARLRATGMNIGKLLDLVEPARRAEASAEFNTPHRQATGVVTIQARNAVVQLRARGFSVKQIGALLDVAELNVARFLSSRGTKVDEGLVMQLHGEGRTPLEIEQQTGMSRPTVVSALARLGVDKPNVTVARVTGPVKDQIVRLRNDGYGYPQIREVTGATTSQITSVLRLAAKKGLLRRYGREEVAA